MVLATARVPADDPTPELDRWRRRPRAGTACSPASPSAVWPTDDVGELLPLHGRDDAAAAELHAATGGNAFFLTELIKPHRWGDSAASSRSRSGRCSACASTASTRSSRRSSTWPPSPAGGDAAGARRRQRPRRRPPARRHRPRRRRRTARRGRRRPPGDAARADRSGRPRTPGPHPAPRPPPSRRPRRSSRTASRTSSPSRLAHHLIEAGALVDRDAACRGRARRRPALRSSIGRLRRCRRPGRARVRALVTEQIDARDRAELSLLDATWLARWATAPWPIEAARAAAELAR